MLTRLLSLLGALLTLLTAAAVLALATRAPPPPASAPAGTSLPAPAAGGEPADSGAATGLKALAPRLLALATNPRLDWLRELGARLRPDGFRLTDTRFTLADTPLGETVTVVLDELRLRPARAGWRADVAGHLAGGPRVGFDGVAALDAGGATDGLRLVLRRVDLGGLLRRVAPELVVDAAGTASVVVTAALADGRLAGDLAATLRLAEGGRLRLRGMAEALPITTLEAAVRPGAGDGLAIERLALTSPAFELAARGELGPERVRLVLGADDVDVTWAPALWPAGVADGARDWVTANVTAGRITRLDLRLDLDREDLARDVLRADALYGEARVDDAEIHYLRPMPPAVGTDATARFDGDRLTFDVARGEAAGVEVTGGEIVVRDYADPATVERLEVTLDGRGRVQAMLALTDHEPLTLASRKGLPVADSAGSGSFVVRVGLPLLQDVELEAVDLAVDGRFTDVRLPGLAAGRDLTDADFELQATADMVRASGHGRVDGVPLELGFEAEGERETLTARGEVEAGRLQDLGAPPLPVEGTVGLDATLVTTADTTRDELRLDVGAAEIEVPELGIWKPRGVAGTVEARVVETAAGVDVERLAVSWPGAEIEGSARLDAAGRLQALRLDPLRVSGTDLSITGTRDDARLALRIRGARLDLAPVTGGAGGEAADDGDDGAAVDWREQAPLTVELAIDEVVAGGDGAVVDLTGRLSTDRERLRRVVLNAGLRPGGGTVRGRLEPTEAGGRFTLTTDDAGALTSALNLTRAVRGGLLEFGGTLTAQRPRLAFEGEVAASDFVLSGAPPVVRVLAAAPATAELADDELAVARFTSPITLDGGLLTLGDALLIASNLAVRTSGEIDLGEGRLDLRGNLAPVQGVNRFIGNLPLIGALLQGSRGAGAFALSFRVAGPWGDPTVNVNPLSVITPGVLRDLFAGAEMRPPRVPHDDD
ncbi:MAG: hypothetical protein GVY33_01695 [Alphaproteobacteria bacterium]|nr:hypothetical protein [Alphaproteobacteria bacterium]